MAAYRIDVTVTETIDTVSATEARDDFVTRLKRDGYEVVEHKSAPVAIIPTKIVLEHAVHGHYETTADAMTTRTLHLVAGQTAVLAEVQAASPEVDWSDCSYFELLIVLASFYPED